MENSIAIDTLKLLAKNHSETWCRDIALKGLMNIAIKKYDIKSGDSIVVLCFEGAKVSTRYVRGRGIVDVHDYMGSRGIVSGVLDGGLLVDIGYLIVDVREYTKIININNKTITL